MTNRPIVLPAVVSALLVCLLGLPASAQPGPLQAPGGPAGVPTDLQPEVPETLAALQRAPELHRGRALSVVGQVVRATQGGARTPGSTSILVRDARGDTIGVLDPEPLPPVGAQVAVQGMVQVGADGGVALARGDGALVVTVLAAPAPEYQADTSSSPGAAARAGTDPCAAREGFGAGLACSLAAVPGWVLGGAGAVLLLAVTGMVLILRRPPGEGEAAVDTDIPLIVDLAARREAARAVEEAPPEVFPAPEPRAALPPANPGMAARQPVAPPIVEPASEDGPPDASSDDMLQLLPGRLEVVQGQDVVPEIRFFRVSSLETPEITFGREEGPPYRHIRLPAPTVSRIHARLRFSGRHWRISNLSEMNPVAVNDRELGGADEELTLQEGDRIRIGDFVFRYRNGRS